MEPSARWVFRSKVWHVGCHLDGAHREESDERSESERVCVGAPGRACEVTRESAKVVFRPLDREDDVGARIRLHQRVPRVKARVGSER